MPNIRQATIEDATKILDISKKAFLIYQQELHCSAKVDALNETIEKVISDISTRTVLVAEENGEVVGSIRMEKLSDDIAYVYRFGVDPSIASTGVGSTLISHIIDICSSENYKAIALHTNSKYYHLARYYYGKGFFVHSTSEAKGYIRALFVKELSSTSYDLTPAFNK